MPPRRHPDEAKALIRQLPLGQQQEARGSDARARHHRMGTTNLRGRASDARDPLQNRPVAHPERVVRPGGEAGRGARRHQDSQPGVAPAVRGTGVGPLHAGTEVPQWPAEARGRQAEAAAVDGSDD